MSLMVVEIGSEKGGGEEGALITLISYPLALIGISLRDFQFWIWRTSPERLLPVFVFTLKWCAPKDPARRLPVLNFEFSTIG